MEKAVKVGLARSKTEALRLGVLALNQEYHLIKDVNEIQEIKEPQAIEKMKRISQEIESGKRKLISHKAVLKKYGFE